MITTENVGPVSIPDDAAEVPAAWSPGRALRAFAIAGLLIVGALFFWQGIAEHGSPDPAAEQTGPWVAILSIAVLVFREGLETILVLTAITASMAGRNQACRKPVGWGAVVGLFATLVTWFIVAGIEHSLADNVPALNLQVWTGLLAIVVLLVVMNWFFHKVYWGGWISMHNRRKKALLAGAQGSSAAASRLVFGLGLLGFASLYREGFEVVLFLQTYYLKLGGKIVLAGAVLGLFFTGIVAVLNFIAHRRLPYRKMLVLTGILLGFVMLVMVGEQGQEMQLAGWIPTTTIKPLEPLMPDWLGLWFSIFPTVETLAMQALAMALVVGSYFLARRMQSSTAA